MSELALRAEIGAPVEQVYRVVADVERYPEFLPDVAAAARRGELVEMTLRLGLVPVRLVTRAQFSPPEAIDLTQVEGPFSRFRARWTFTPTPGGTEVRYQADYALPLGAGLLGPAARLMLSGQVERQIRAFEARVRHLAADAAPRA